MTEMLLFHHALGPTDGVESFAGGFRDAGHIVHVPDLFDGSTFDTIDEGVGYAREVGFDTIQARASAAVDALPNELVYAGLSLGVMPAQMLAQTRAGARGAVLIAACFPPEEFGGDWPAGVEAQIHMMDADPFGLEGDLDAARLLADSTSEVELFLYPGDRHLFVDETLPDHDAAATATVRERVLRFLEASA